MPTWDKFIEVMPRRRALAAIHATILLFFLTFAVTYYSRQHLLDGTPVPRASYTKNNFTDISAIRRERLERLSQTRVGNVYLGDKGSGPNYAYATFLAENAEGSTNNGEDNNDMYFVATRLLGYKLMHDEQTRTKNGIPFVVIVTDAVSERKRARLRKDGAVVVPVEDIKLQSWIWTGVRRWKDQFTKLRLFELVEYDLIMFIDADTLVLHPMDDIFRDPAVADGPKESLRESRKSALKEDEALIPKKYVFAARADNLPFGARDHPYPPPFHGESFSAGFWMAMPSFEMFDYYHSVMQLAGRFDPHDMEQSLLNYAHRSSGPMPWASLATNWSATWPNEKDLDGGCATLHEKFWDVGPTRLRNLWSKERSKMEKFYEKRDGK